MEEKKQGTEMPAATAGNNSAASPSQPSDGQEQKGGKEHKPRRKLTPKELQMRKKLLVYPLMGLLFLGSMWLIFAPSEKKDGEQETVGAFNADIPMPENGNIIGDKRKAYELAQMEKQQSEKVRSLQDFAFSDTEDKAPDVELELSETEPEQPVSRSDTRSSAVAYRDINRQLGSFYETPEKDAEKEELKRQVEELTKRLEEKQQDGGTLDEQVALMEKSYELAAKYMNNPQNGQGTAMTEPTSIHPSGNTPGRKPLAVQAAREQTVSGLQPPMSDEEFMSLYSQPRNYGFNTAVGSGYAIGRNTIRACIHTDQTIMDGQTVKLRLLEPLQAGNLVIPQNTVVSGTGRVQGERLDITVSSIEYRGNLLPVELAVYDSDGIKGLSVPSSLEQEAAKEAMANIGSGLGTSISFAQSAGQQVAMDITRGLMQGGSQYLAKKFRTVKVHLKAGYRLMLYAKEQ